MNFDHSLVVTITAPFYLRAPSPAATTLAKLFVGNFEFQNLLSVADCNKMFTTVVGKIEVELTICLPLNMS